MEKRAKYFRKHNKIKFDADRTSDVVRDFMRQRKSIRDPHCSSLRY